MKSLIAAAVVALCLGCSGKDEGKNASVASDTTTVPQSNSDQNACSTIPAAELTEALGRAVTRQESPASTRCIYYTAEPLIYADIQIDRVSGDAAWQGVNGGDSIIGAPQDSLAGLGDKAFFGPRDRLYVKKGSTFIAIEAGFDAKVRERAKNIARVVISKL